MRRRYTLILGSGLLFGCPGGGKPGENETGPGTACPEGDPEAPDLCDGFDSDCDGEIDEAAPVSSWSRDADGDGYGDAADTVTGSSSCFGAVLRSADTDGDGQADVAVGEYNESSSYPGYEELTINEYNGSLFSPFIGGSYRGKGSFGRSFRPAATGAHDDA